MLGGVGVESGRGESLREKNTTNLFISERIASHTTMEHVGGPLLREHGKESCLCKAVVFVSFLPMQK